MRDKIGEGISLFLLKFTDYPDDLLDGNIYMGNLKKYIDMEKENQNKGMGDLFEGAHIFRDMEITIHNQSNNQVLLKGQASSLTFRYDRDEKKPVFCMFELTDKHFKFQSEDDNSMYFVLNIEESEINHMLELFSDQLVLVETAPFLKRFSEKSKKRGYSVVHRPVVYDDFSINNFERIESYFQEESNVFFWKEKFFEKQNEYRFVILNEEVEDALIFNVGSVRDIARKFNAKDFFSVEFGIKIPKTKIEDLKLRLNGK